eukprot:365321-Chlamydomonas_euryale.AAC.26
MLLATVSTTAVSSPSGHPVRKPDLVPAYTARFPCPAPRPPPPAPSRALPHVAVLPRNPARHCRSSPALTTPPSGCGTSARVARWPT